MLLGRTSDKAINLCGLPAYSPYALIQSSAKTMSVDVRWERAMTRSGEVHAARLLENSRAASFTGPDARLSAAALVLKREQS